MHPRRDDIIDDALARATIYQSLSLAFQPPTVERWRQLGATSGFATLWAAVARTARERGADGAELDAAGSRLAALQPPAANDAERHFFRLFGHTARGLVCPCETEYGQVNAFQQPQQLADLAGYYLAFGLRPDTAADVRIDHIACECEFMDFLNRKEAALLGAGAPDEDTLAVTRSASRMFLRDHLARFGCAVAGGLLREDGDGCYGAFGALLLSFLRSDCARLGVDPGPMDLPIRPEIDDVPAACGDGQSELIQITRRP